MSMINWQAKTDEALMRKARMSDDTAWLKEFKALMITHGKTESDGTVARATLSTAERISERWKALALSFKPSRQKLKAYETVTPVVTLRINARKL